MRDDFNLIWKLLPHPPGSVVRTFARSGNVRTGDFARTPAELRKFARQHEDMNIYLAPNPTNYTGGSRHSAKHVTHWSYFLIDMDPVGVDVDCDDCDGCGWTEGGKALQTDCLKCSGKGSVLDFTLCHPQQALAEALAWLGEWTGKTFWGTQTPIIIDSGRGFQAWIRLEDIPLDDNMPLGKIAPLPEPGGGCTSEKFVSRKTARLVNGYWLKKLDEKLGVAHGCRIDTSVSDLPRVMRCPGTTNQKTNRSASVARLSNVVFGGLATLLVVGTPARLFDEDADEAPSGVREGQSWQKVFPHLTRTSQSYLTLGQEEPGRHKVMWHTAKKLRELGVTRDEARRALRHANRLKGKDDELPRDQIEHALDTAYLSEEMA